MNALNKQGFKRFSISYKRRCLITRVYAMDHSSKIVCHRSFPTHFSTYDPANSNLIKQISNIEANNATILCAGCNHTNKRITRFRQGGNDFLNYWLVDSAYVCSKNVLGL